MSNVLNRPEIVADATRARVRETIDALGFVRNTSARRPRGPPGGLLTEHRVQGVVNHTPVNDDGSRLEALRARGTSVVVVGREVPGVPCAASPATSTAARSSPAVTSSHRPRARGVRRSGRVLRRSADDRGVRVPDDVAIVGYDDIQFASQSTIPLTTVRQPTYQIGRTATVLLLGSGLLADDPFDPGGRRPDVDRRRQEVVDELGQLVGIARVVPWARWARNCTRRSRACPSSRRRTPSRSARPTSWARPARAAHGAAAGVRADPSSSRTRSCRRLRSATRAPTSPARAGATSASTPICTCACSPDFFAKLAAHHAGA